MSDTMAARLNQLEEAFAHSEAQVQDLSDELAKQWLTIERMTRRIQELEEKIDTLRLSSDDPPAGDPPPPHY